MGNGKAMLTANQISQLVFPLRNTVKKNMDDDDDNNAANET